MADNRNVSFSPILGFPNYDKNKLYHFTDVIYRFIYSNSCSNAPIENSNYQNNQRQEQLEPEPKKPIEPESTSEDFVTITKLNKQKTTEGKFETRGFIAKIYTRPPCPPDAQCKPCMKNNTLILEEKKSIENYYIGLKDLIIFTSDEKNTRPGRNMNLRSGSPEIKRPRHN